MPRDALRPLPAAISLFASAVAAPAGWPGLELGIREFRAAAGERPAILGGRRIDEAAIDTLLRASEDDFFALPACSSRRRARLRLGRLLAAMCGEPNAGGG
jgi:hypothetical protein